MKKEFSVQYVQNKLYNINWKEQIFGMGKLLLGGGILFQMGDEIFVWWVYRSNEKHINETMEKGTRLQLIVSDDEYISRPEDIERFKIMFKPNKNHANYHVVCGEHGTGKTTLLRIAANEVKKGVIYISFSENLNKLGDEFGRALNLTFEEDVSITMQLLRKFFGWNKGDEFKNSYSKWERAMDIIKHNSKILDILQDGAKINADDQKYIAVFVSSEGLVSRRMESRSAWSCADKPVMEIGDLSEKESKDYLIKRCTIKEEKRAKSVTDKFLAGQFFEVIKQQTLTEVKKKFDLAKLLRNQIHHEVGKSVINVLLNSKEIDTNVFKEFFKNENYNEALEANVFAYHPSRDTVTFQSQSVEFYIRENSNIFTK
ncbi:hypothetical protein C1645_819161 [Glomus cerebriforme]|uniref:ATPase AAA-type core domain-containing protein n=1 Tax=Glomus cerebriforme TaxID=658196 RepID=A0A397T5U2_9GLOM|nr:hypothetical protein C1645_819161 [Glomus cerebriforme]